MKEHVLSFSNWLVEQKETEVLAEKEAEVLAEKEAEAEVLAEKEAEAEVLAEKEEYKEFFNKKLEKFKVKSPNELDDEKKKEFFDEIEKEWDSEKA